MNNTRKKTNIMGGLALGRRPSRTKKGGFNSSRATPRRVETPKEVQEHQEED
jgi:hypothetical protein